MITASVIFLSIGYLVGLLIFGQIFLSDDEDGPLGKLWALVLSIVWPITMTVVILITIFETIIASFEKE